MYEWSLYLARELAFLLLAALGGVQIGQRFHHGQHDVARFAVAGLAVVPHAVDVLPGDDRLAACSRGCTRSLRRSTMSAISSLTSR